jgi:tRNA U38,U39,U40 pseudouridine synthase TruA
MRCQVAEQGEKILLRVEASHFLWKMIRRITGTLVEAGRGKLDAAAIRRMLESRTREPARWTAPPSGLFLDRVTYPDREARRPSPPSDKARLSRPGPRGPRKRP